MVNRNVFFLRFIVVLMLGVKIFRRRFVVMFKIKTCRCTEQGRTFSKDFRKILLEIVAEMVCDDAEIVKVFSATKTMSAVVAVRVLLKLNAGTIFA